MSLFIEPDAKAIEASARLGAQVVELHTGAYCERALEDDAGRPRARARAACSSAAQAAAAAGLEVHAGHGLTFNTVGAVARIPEIVELNIGHFLIGEAIFSGLGLGHRAHARADGRGAPADAAGERAGRP